MGTTKRLAKYAIIGLLLSAIPALALTSITPGIFTTLVGLFVQPITTSYSYSTQLQTPAVTAASSTPGGSLSGGPLVVKVAALSLTGTSSPSNEIATTTNPSTSLYLSWPAIPGATGYAIYIGTSTAGSEQSYFMATSTAGAVNTNYTLTSTSSPTYYAIPGQGAGYFARHGSASTTLDTSGLIRSEQAATTTSCTTALNGTMFYSTANSHLWLCTGAGPAWTLIK